MIHLITGGSGSGKSCYAEHLIQKFSEQVPEAEKIYIATMHRNQDLETVRRIQRHREMRAGMGFKTLEWETLPDVDAHASGEEKAALNLACLPKPYVLLEDLSNLLANEMFLPAGRMKYEEGIKSEVLQQQLSDNVPLVRDAEIPTLEGSVQMHITSEMEDWLWVRAEERLLNPITALSRQAAELVIVSNEIFSDGIRYDPETERYITLLGRLNQGIGQQAATVTEIVAGIPIRWKG